MGILFSCNFGQVDLCYHLYTPATDSIRSTKLGTKKLGRHAKEHSLPKRSIQHGIKTHHELFCWHGIKNDHKISASMEFHDHELFCWHGMKTEHEIFFRCGMKTGHEFRVAMESKLTEIF